MDSFDNLYTLTTELDRAAHAIQALLICVRDGVTELPAGFLEESEAAMSSIVAWSVAIKQRIKH